MPARASDTNVTGPLRVMGWRHKNADANQGLQVALSLVRYLAFHPATARHLAFKLVRRFVSDSPPAGLVASAAKVYLQHNTAIVPVVKHIVLSEEFAASSGRKAQRPFEWFARAVRALGAGQHPAWHANPDAVIAHLAKLGQVYPDRLNTVDMRFTKILRFGRTRTNVGVDLYNLFNANTGTTFNQTFGTDGSTYLRPNAILNPRYVRFNATIDF